VVFLGLWVLQSTFSQDDLQDVKDVKELWGTSFVFELVSIGLAVDAYRMAREREKQILATIQLPPRITGNFPAAIPVGLSLLLGAGYFAVADHGLYAELREHRPVNRPSRPEWTRLNLRQSGIRSKPGRAWLLGH
jgi:hypothetical protein